MNINGFAPRGTLCAIGLLLLSTTSALAVAGNQSAGNGQIGQAHIDLAIPFGNTVAFIDYNNSTATGTFVPSSVPGQLKFLTAAHNVANNKGVLNGGANTLTFYFGGRPGLNGANATYRVVVQPSAIALKPNWGTSNGAATNDLAVITFTEKDLVAVTEGAAIPTVSPIYNLNPVNQQGLVIGFGLSGDGTVALDGNNPNIPAQNQVDGILKAGWNVVGGVGVPGTNGLPEAGATVSANSGTVVLVDFDQSINNGAGFTPQFSTMNDPLPPARQALEGGTASGDSGSPFLIDSNNDGIFEVSGVLNGGDNPIEGQGVSRFGDISQYAPVFNDENRAFLTQQGVFLGTAYQGVTISGQMVIVNTAAALANQAVADQINILRRMDNGSIKIVQQRAGRTATGQALITPPAGGATGATTFGFGGIAQRNAEVFFEGSFADTDNTGVAQGQAGIEFRMSDSLMLGAALGAGSSSGNSGNEWLSATGYAIAVVDRYTLSATASWSGHDIDSITQGSQLNADADMASFQLAAIMRHEFGNLILLPSASVSYTYGSLENASITTNGVTTALSDEEFDQYRFEAGVTASTKLDRDWGAIIPFVGAHGGWRDTTMDGAVTAGGVQPFQALQAVGGQLQFVNLGISTPGAQTDPGALYGVLSAGAELQWLEGQSIAFTASAQFDEVAGASYGATIRFGVTF